MSDIELDRVIDGIDRHLPYLHKERWAVEAAKLRRTVREATGDDKARAEQALQAHYETMNRPETSRAPLVQQAKENHAAQQRA